VAEWAGLENRCTLYWVPRVQIPPSPPEPHPTKPLNHSMRGHANISGAVDIERADIIVDFPKNVNTN
jgi:hypothetical protein